MQTITSLRNPTVLSAKALQDKFARDESGLFLCEGEHMVGEAMQNAQKDVRVLFVQDSKLEQYSALVTRATQAECYTVPGQVLAALSQVKAQQGIAAVVSQPPRATLETLGSRVVLLENVQDPGNVGTILRTADASGFSACILTAGSADPFSPKALRATMGSVFRVPVAVLESATQAVLQLKESGYAVLACALDGDDFYARGPLPQKVCLIIGNEGAGITPQTQAQATMRYRLPMRGGAESLNAAVAAAIFMYEIVNRG
jgi:RNA methyltransferase, TrmH family